jgi:pimeloyl-ACP methyl ester carboxylesterase
VSTSAENKNMSSQTTVWAVRGGLVCLAIGLLLAANVARRSFAIEWSVFAPPRGPVPRPVAAPAQLRELDFLTRRGVRLKGWYLPSSNRALVILCHGSGANRSSLWNEALALHERGFGALLYDSPGHGDSAGEVHWGEGELEGLEGALDAAGKLTDVAPDRIGVYGFSMGGYVAALVAARDPRVRALSIASAPAHLRRHLSWEYRQFGPLSHWPALWAVQLRGLPLDGPMPVDVIARLSPRPLLVISGDHDSAVPLAMTRELFEAARQPKQLLIVKGADHGDYANHDGRAFIDGVHTFFDGALLGTR